MMAMAPAAIWGPGDFLARRPLGEMVKLQRVGRPDLSQRVSVVAHAEIEAGQEFEVEQPKPIGVTWTRCADGAIYASRLDKNADPRIQLGDKLLRVSASFGDEIWPAESYGQTMMAIRTRVGAIYMQILSRGGNTDVLEQKTVRSEFQKERSGGNYGAGTAEEQSERYAAQKSTERDRIKLFDSGITHFKAGEYKEALADFEESRGLEPKNFVGDNFARVTEVYKVASYNIACCYSKLNLQEEGLKALNEALSSGFDDYKKVRSDPYLEFVRESPKFKNLIDEFDEPLFNEEVFNIFKNFR